MTPADHPEATGLREAAVGDLVHDRGETPDVGWFIVGEGGYFDVDNAAWCEPNEGDAPWSSEWFDLFGPAVAHAALLAAHPTPEPEVERPRCDTCSDTGRIPWMIEGDPNCYQEPDDEGMLPCPDCTPEPDAGDVEARDLETTIGLLPDCDHPTSQGVCPRCIATAVLASDWLAAYVAAAVDRIARAIEAEASRSSYRDAEEVTEAYLHAARIAGGDA